MGWNSKVKTLNDLSFQNGDNSVDITFSSKTIDVASTPNWVNRHQNQSCPDVWIYASGLWDHPRHTSDEVYRNRTKLLADYDHRCVRHKILRLTTPYQPQSQKPVDVLNNKTSIYNKIASSLLLPVGFREVDAFAIFKPLVNLSHDGVHYTGPGSKWLTNTILNMICEEHLFHKEG